MSLPRLALALALAVSLALLFPSGAGAGEREISEWRTEPSGASPVFPASWEGIWLVTTTVFDCGSGAVEDVYTEPDTICAGETLSFTVDGIEITCSGTITDDTVNVVCRGRAVPFPGCTAAITSDVGGTRQGDEFELQQDIRVDFGGFFCPQDLCFRATVAGTRTATGEKVCPTPSPVRPDSWGVIKARYGRSD